MKLIVGLGNPGEKYKNTRHNVGFMTLDRIVKQVKSAKLKVQSYSSKFKIKKKLQSEICEMRIGDKKVILTKPLTFMNKSGEAVSLLAKSYKLKATSLIILHDDLDIPLGKYKIQFGKGPREHWGVESVGRALGTKDFWRVRIGIENRSQDHKNTRTQEQGRISGEEYVLQEFTREEKKIIDGVILEVVEEIKRRFLKS